MSRLDAVTIRIGLPGPQTGRAAEALGLPGITPSRSTLHLIDYRPGSAPSSLASAGITVSIHDSGNMSLLTVQVRYVRPTRLPPRWAAFYGQNGETLRVEEERDSTRRVLAASYSAPSQRAAQALTGADLRLTDLLTPSQSSFSRDCAPGQPRAVPLDLFGPIAVLSWTVRLDRVDATVNVWRLPAARDETRPAVELMEVSRRSALAEAGFIYPVLAASIRRRGLDPDGGVPWLEMRAARWLSRDSASPSPPGQRPAREARLPVPAAPRPPHAARQHHQAHRAYRTQAAGC
jgi:hypothetical protein